MTQAFRIVGAIGLCIVASQASAVPSLAFEHAGPGSIKLLLAFDTVGAFQTEVALFGSGGLYLSNATLADSETFSEEIAGDSPFIPGSPIGGDATGLNIDSASGQVFAAFGGYVLEAGVYEFLAIEAFNAGELTAEGFVSHPDAPGSPITPVDADLLRVYIVGDTNLDGVINTLDIDPFVQTLTEPDVWRAAHPGVSMESVADMNEDGVVNTLDIAKWTEGFHYTNAPIATGITPEPATASLAGLAITGVLGFRRRR